MALLTGDHATSISDLSGSHPAHQMEGGGSGFSYAAEKVKIFESVPNAGVAKSESDARKSILATKDADFLTAE